MPLEITRNRPPDFDRKRLHIIAATARVFPLVRYDKASARPCAITSVTSARTCPNSLSVPATRFTIFVVPANEAEQTRVSLDNPTAQQTALFLGGKVPSASNDDSGENE